MLLVPKFDFLPEGKYFDTHKFSVAKLKHVLRAKAVLCAKLKIIFVDENTGATDEWYYEDGLPEYLVTSLNTQERLPYEPFVGSFTNDDQVVDWALTWLPNGGELITESYVNLIPTVQEGTHVNGLRTGLLDSMREFCETHDLLPRGLKLSSEDIWERCSYILSVKLPDPQFSGQTKERLTSRDCQTFVANTVRDAFSLWLNQQMQIGEAVSSVFY